MSGLETQRFDTAYAEFKRLRAIELALPVKTDAQVSALEAATKATDAAFDEMMLVPASDGDRVWSKLSALREFYSTGGFEHSGEDQVFAEVCAALTGKVLS